MASAGGPASIITQVQQSPGPPINALGVSDAASDENLTLDLRGTRFTLSRDELLTLPEFVLLSLFPNGLLPDGHMNTFHEGDVYPVDVCFTNPHPILVLGNPNVYLGDLTIVSQYDPASLQYMLDFFRGVAQSIPSASPSPTGSPEPDPISIEPLQGSARDMLQDRAGIIVLREDLDFYVIPPRQDIQQAEMLEVKRAAAKSLLKQDGIFSGLKRSEETGTTEQHLIEMLTAGGFDHDDRWGHRAGEPNKAVICSLALARLRTDIKGDMAANNVVGMAQKLLLFWRKPARRCWWEGVDLTDVKGVEGTLKVWIRRVWTLEMYDDIAIRIDDGACAAFVSSYAPRLRQYGNTLIQPVAQTQSILPGGRTTKRGTTVINYADDAYDDDDFEDSDGPRRPTGLRSIRREDLEKKEPQHEKYGKEISAPVDLQPIYRDWMVRRTVKPSTEREMHIQAHVAARLAISATARAIPDELQFGAAMYKKSELVPAYKIRDVFLWNLHENLITPEEFATIFVRELDLSPFDQRRYVDDIAKQIRGQLEDYAGIALHPLFYTQPAIQRAPVTNGTAAQPQITNGDSQVGTPSIGTPRMLAASISRPNSAIPAPSTPGPETPLPQPLPNGASVEATADLMPIEPPKPDIDPSLNPDDTYRCIVTLSVYLASKLYQDKFEWSLLHPPGAAEAFARQTCADMGLGGEWVLAITHAIYEAVLRLKKEACEGQILLAGEIDNQAVRPEENAGWRYDVDDFGAEWEPKFEELTKEEIEKKEGDRERQLRRLRRDAAKLTSNAGMLPSAREQEAQIRGSYFDMPGLGMGGDETPMMGRGERAKKKRRFRSLSPLAKAGTPDAANSAGAAWGGEGSKLTEDEKRSWRCTHCHMPASAVWAVRDGPAGPRTLCNNCGLLYERDQKLPVWSEGLHRRKG
ncbi:WHI2-like protein P4H10.16c [Cyphellophora attinorum]|uniref:WHI2-like protein P4H10.16c n=1 Tax=Cyphellophora attinorum TaxID=1664694 RepID=A0A0N1H5C8_9EURO|nr:WHI2-like protein P4H10.16c [Phialophora attinorum]KPI36920.1 WHI2-like protein P4H10.16c [Phialophora attinorum]